jgi:hypothetical protein
MPEATTGAETSVDLYWLPLGAGGWFVKLNGRVYEGVHALVERRHPLALYHCALEVRVPEGRFVVENSWPIPDADGASRGVVVEGPVGSRRIARFRVFRYEVRRWRDGIIADAGEAIASPQTLTTDPVPARRLLDLVAALPTPVCGRDELGAGEMWNSNSVISWLLARSGLPVDGIRPPIGGRAPGWAAGVVVAARAPDGTPRTFSAGRPGLPPLPEPVLPGGWWHQRASGVSAGGERTRWMERHDTRHRPAGRRDPPLRGPALTCAARYRRRRPGARRAVPRRGDGRARRAADAGRRRLRARTGGLRRHGGVRAYR